MTNEDKLTKERHAMLSLVIEGKIAPVEYNRWCMKNGCGDMGLELIEDENGNQIGRNK